MRAKNYFHGVKFCNMRFFWLAVMVSIFFPGCTQEPFPEFSSEKEYFIRAVDISGFPEIESSNPVFRNSNDQEEGFLKILKNAGVNTIRLRLWVNPESGHSGLFEVTAFSHRLREMGFKIWISVHYSDTWADPGQQEIPLAWQNLSYTALKDSVREYTRNVAAQIRPEFIQIGNEINSGFLHPHGHRRQSPEQFQELLSIAAQSIRTTNPSTKIIMHYAGMDGAKTFFEEIRLSDYDIIGLSYYPLWHGKRLENLKDTLHLLSESFPKEVLIAETAYPFTLSWNDWTNNIIGLDSQLILPDYPATPRGQSDFLHAVRQIAASTRRGIGFCYWGAEWIAWRGPEAMDGSPWENQALFDFQNRALPVLNAFKPE